MDSGITLRAATADDASALLGIYAPYVERTAVTFEYAVPSLADFRERIASTLVKYPFIVAERDGLPAGYAYAAPFRARAAYDWAVETSIYVAMEKRRRGVGKALYDALEKSLALQGFTNLNACIAYADTDNDAHLNNDSTKFHECFGYALVGHFHKCGLKFGVWYDMIWMEKFIGAHCVPQPPVKPFREVVPQLVAEGAISG